MKKKHPWIGKKVQPVDPEHLWRRSPITATVKDVVESIQGSNSEVVVLVVKGFSTDVKQPLSDFEIVD